MFIAFLCCCDAMCTATEINGAATMTQRQCELYCTHTQPHKYQRFAVLRRLKTCCSPCKYIMIIIIICNAKMVRAKTDLVKSNIRKYAIAICHANLIRANGWLVISCHPPSESLYARAQCTHMCVSDTLLVCATNFCFGLNLLELKTLRLYPRRSSIALWTVSFEFSFDNIIKMII